MATSVAQEYYKLQEEWGKIDKKQTWRLAVWLAEYPDVDIIEKFMEIERSPIGQFADLFFKFESVYPGDSVLFEQALWQEFQDWFLPSVDPSMDMNQALFENGFLTAPFVPDTSLEPTAKNLWKEFLRLREQIQGIDNTTHFCLYFPLVAYNKEHISSWFKEVIEEVPQGIRLVTLDLAQDRKIKLSTSSQGVETCVYMHPKLDMASAIRNEMSKDSGNYDTVDLQSRFSQQVLVVMESTTAVPHHATRKEVAKLFELTQEIGTLSAHIAGLLVAAQAYYAIRDHDQSSKYTDQALEQARKAMDSKDPSGYPVWKSCMLLKAALLFGKKKLKEARSVYDELADKAEEQVDAYYIMEGRRLSGHISYELRQYEKAFQHMLLALTAGAYLELPMRRQSTFLHAAYMALYIADRVRSNTDKQVLESQIAAWLGDDWEELLAQAGVETASTKMKTSLF